MPIEVETYSMLKARQTIPFMLLPILWVGSAHAATPLSDSQEDAGELGNALQYAVPVAALALTFVLDGLEKPSALGLNFNTDTVIHMDGSPRHDLALAFGRSILITHALKYGFNETRPNGGKHSFPSGHTSAAFTGAEFIRKEYGWWWGLPAYAVASYVGWSRVESREHYTRDVVAGAAIGILANHDLRELHTRYGALSFSPAAASSEGRPVMGLQLKLAF